MPSPSEVFVRLLTKRFVDSWTLTPAIPAGLMFDPAVQAQGAGPMPGIDEYSPAPGTWTPEEIRNEVGYAQLQLSHLTSLGSEETSGLVGGVNTKIQRISWSLDHTFVTPVHFTEADLGDYLEAVEALWFGLDSVYTGPPLLHISHFPAEEVINFRKIGDNAAWREDVASVIMQYEYQRPIVGPVSLSL